jgi:cyclophilin family peptidyl-prolyl cis-trans isomerase
MSKLICTPTSGVIRIELNDERAPLSAANFLEYVKSGHYDGTVFHRVIKGFMVQGGGMEPGMKQKSTLAAIQNEANNGLKNNKYTLAMARTNAPHSATAQFFINTVNNDFLNFSSPTPSRMGLCGVRQGGVGHRGGGPDREGAHRPQRLPRRRAAGRRGDPARRCGGVIALVESTWQLQDSANGPVLRCSQGWRRWTCCRTCT